MMLLVSFSLQANYVSAFKSNHSRTSSFLRFEQLLEYTLGSTYSSSHLKPSSTTTAYDGGDFTLDFTAAAPYTYNHFTGGGSFDDRTIGKTSDVVESLEGGDFKCGDIVTFLTKVTVANDAEGIQTIEIDYSFTADATGQPGVALADIVGVSINYGAIPTYDVDGDGDLDVIGDGTGGTDAAIKDDLGSSATLSDEMITGNGELFQDNNLLGTVTVTDLEAGETVVVRVDVMIACDPDSSPTGNLQAALTAGIVLNPTDAIRVGNQTVPFKNVGDILPVGCEITPGDPVCAGATTAYTATSVVPDAVFVWSITGNGTIAGAAGDGTKTITATGGATTTSVNVDAGAAGSYTIAVNISKPGYSSQSCSQVITVNPPATADAGSDITVCSSDIPSTGVALSGSVGGGATSGTWSIVTGNGSLSGNNYLPAAGELTANSTVTLRYTTDDPAGPCTLDTDDMDILIYPAATANAGPDIPVCSSSIPGTGVALSGSVGGGATSGTWSIVTGSGSLSGANYIPTGTELAGATITLRYSTDDPSGPCGIVTDDMDIVISPAATANAGADMGVCSSDVPAGGVALGGTFGGGASSGTWSVVTGAGAISGNNYVPTNTELANGATVTLRYSTNDPLGPCGIVSDDMDLAISTAATANAGADIPVCTSSISSTGITLNGGFGGGATSGTWSIVTGAGTLSLAGTEYLPSSGEMTSGGTVTLRFTTNDPAGQCLAASDDMDIVISPAATVGAGGPYTVACAEVRRVQLNGSFGGGATSGTWSGGSGTFDPNNTTANAYYVPSAAELLAGTPVTLTFTTDNPTSPCEAVNAQATVNFDVCQIVEGCTLGYWKNHTDRWACYTPNTLYKSVFTSAPSKYNSLTLLQALNLGGGDVENLLRQSVAALLNICSSEVDYNEAYPTTSSLIAAVNTALATSSKKDDGRLAATLDNYNNAEGGCPMGGSSATTTATSTSSLYTAENSLTMFPNPFSHTATVEFIIEQGGEYELVLHDMSGRVVKHLSAGTARAGKRNSVTLDATSLKEGLYVARITSGTMTKTVRIILKR